MVRKPLLLPSGGEVLEEVGTRLELVVWVGIDIVLDMGVNVIEGAVIGVEDVDVVDQL